MKSEKEWESNVGTFTVYFVLFLLGYFIILLHTYYSFERFTKCQLLLTKQIQRDYRKVIQIHLSLYLYRARK